MDKRRLIFNVKTLPKFYKMSKIRNDNAWGGG